MKPRDALVGGIVLAVLAIGAWVANHPAGGTASDAEVPDISVADGAVASSDLLLRFSVTPRPITAFAPTRFRVRAERGGKPVAIDNGEVSFTMSMTMGDHRYRLQPGADGWWEAEAVLPACASGHKRWYGDVTLAADGQPHAARFQFDLEPDLPPGAGP